MMFSYGAGKRNHTWSVNFTATVFALIYGTTKNNCIGDRSVLVKNHFPSRSNKLERFCMCRKQFKSYGKKRDGSIHNDVNAADNTEISLIAYAVETPVQLKNPIGQHL